MLLGSGVFASAGIPTGWQIVSDLLTKVAKLEGADAGDDPISWYKQRYGDEPHYPGLLNNHWPIPPPSIVLKLCVSRSVRRRDQCLSIQ